MIDQLPEPSAVAILPRLPVLPESYSVTRSCLQFGFAGEDGRGAGCNVITVGLRPLSLPESRSGAFAVVGAVKSTVDVSRSDDTVPDVARLNQSTLTVRVCAGFRQRAAGNRPFAATVCGGGAKLRRTIGVDTGVMIALASDTCR